MTAVANHRRAALAAAGCALWVALGAAPRASAQEEPRSQAAEAKAAYDRAEADYQLGHFREALGNYEAAYHLRPKAALLFNIAQCHRQMEAFAMAAKTYRSFIRL